MSTQFVFWRTSKRLDSRKVYGRLMNGKPVRGLESLDLDSVEAALIAGFPGWTVVTTRSATPGQTALEENAGPGALDVGYSPQSVSVTCYNTGEGVWNEIIELMATLKLPLYDAQTGERFDSVTL